MKNDSVENAILADRVIVDQDLKIDICDNMEKYGGSFVKALSKCIILADSTNLRKLVYNFAQYVREYMPENWKKPSIKTP